MKIVSSTWIGGAILATLAGMLPNVAAAATTLPVVNYYGYFGNTQGAVKVEAIKNGEPIYFAGANEDVKESTPTPIRNVDGRSFEVLIGGVYQVEYAVNSFRLAGNTPADVPSPNSEHLAVSLRVNGLVDVGAKNDCSFNALVPPLAAPGVTETLRGSFSHSCFLTLRKKDKIKLVPTWSLPANSTKQNSTFQMVYPSSEASNNANVFKIMFVKIGE